MSFELKVSVDNTKLIFQNLDLMENVVEKLATETELTMKKSITTGSKTGREYKRRGVIHRSSAPGQAPANDLGNLANSIISKKIRKGLAEVVIGALYAGPLEFGTSRMKPRPFIVPALLKVSKKVEKLLGALFK